MGSSEANFQQEIGDNVSETFFDACKQTWGNGTVANSKDHFRSSPTVSIGDTRVGMHSDGIGTKVEVAERMGRFDTLGWDLVAMVCDDVVAKGGLPKMLNTTLDVGMHRHLFPWDQIQDLARGLVAAAQHVNIPIVGGEFAQMGRRIYSEADLPFIWNATVAWTTKGIPIMGERIGAGNSIVALQETGCRSNGYTLLREILEVNLGEKWHEERFADSEVRFGDMALQPSTIYTKHIEHLTHGSGLPVTGMIHVTGGGLAGRLRSYLSPYGLGATLDNPYPPGALFRYIIDKGWLGMRAAYEHWCMGNGFLIITPKPGDVIDFLVSKGTDAQLIGRVLGVPKVEINPPVSLEYE